MCSCTSTSSEQKLLQQQLRRGVTRTESDLRLRLCVSSEVCARARRAGGTLGCTFQMAR